MRWRNGISSALAHGAAGAQSKQHQALTAVNIALAAWRRNSGAICAWRRCISGQLSALKANISNGKAARRRINNGWRIRENQRRNGIGASAVHHGG